ncbi:MAG: MarR family transcriptional regulator [Flavobacteriaceae bacterium]|nr:MarR family transcriptional regulator [Bacteroidia bacterium]NNF82305.1 MarR family transcriptional regulator [Flavobacteriaceae bacterium]NNK69929.1 MarR family transcriptional regulator [Flavobacteriaceae bacterium]
MGDLSEDIKSSFPNKRVKALLNILYTANWIRSHQNDFFKPYGISPQQYNILRILKGANEPVKVQWVKDRMIERAPNATRLMDKLCGKDLMKRIPCKDDRRVVFVEITPNGLALLKTIGKSMDLNVLDNLSEAEAGKLSDLLDKIR